MRKIGIFGFNRKNLNNVTGFSITNLFDDTYAPFGDNMLESNIVRSCIDFIASTVAKCEVNHVHTDKDGRIQLINDELLATIKNPNSYQNGFAFLYRLISELYISNNAFVYLEYKGTKLEALHVIDYGSVELREKNNQLYATFYLTSQGQNVTVAYEDLIHIRRHYNSKTFYADNSTRCLNKVLETNNTIAQGITNTINLSTKLKVILKYAGVLKESDKEKEIAKFEKMLKEGQGVAGIDSKCDLSTLSVSPKVVDFETIAIVKREIYAFFNLTEELVNGSAKEQAIQNMYDQVISPLLSQLNAEFTKKLFTKKEIKAGHEIRFTSQTMLFASLTTKTSLIKEAMSLGVININEARAILGLSPIEGGEVRLQSLNFVNTAFVDEYQLGRAGGDIGAVNEIQETETPESKVNIETKEEEKVEETKQEEVVDTEDKVEDAKQENENVDKQDVKEETKQEEKVEDAKQEEVDADKTDETDESELPEKQKKKKRRNKK